jgi:hypothetical protein
MKIYAFTFNARPIVVRKVASETRAGLKYPESEGRYSSPSVIGWIVIQRCAEARARANERAYVRMRLRESPVYLTSRKIPRRGRGSDLAGNQPGRAYH